VILLADVASVGELVEELVWECAMASWVAEASTK
jgi:hypothetical protein